jgi:hypothetical protein
MTPTGTSRLMATAEQFTAWAMCPACELFDYHGLRVPKPFDATDAGHVAFEKIMMMQWVCGIGLDRMSPSQEATYEVIRTCRCGHEWGQI